MTDGTERIARIIAPSIEAMGYEVVRVQLGGSQRATLQVMVERVDGANMTVEDCVGVSRAVSALLDVEDPIPGSYTLEVSSPGIDRPLTRRKDFERFTGFEARLESRTLVDGRRRFRGLLRGLVGDEVRIETADGVALVPLREIERAKLVLNDELIAAGRGRR
jgi:ribosome maturation factor RimP